MTIYDFIFLYFLYIYIYHSVPTVQIFLLSLASCFYFNLLTISYHFLPLAIGVTNQRETTLVWDKETGEPLYNAIGKLA